VKDKEHLKLSLNEIRRLLAHKFNRRYRKSSSWFLVRGVNVSVISPRENQFFSRSELLSDKPE
jgi:hypothetical protein